MMLRDRVMALLGGLSRQYGVAWATERKKRTFLGHNGPKPGQRSISRVERQLAAAGRLQRRRVMPGGRLPDGMYTRRGTVIVQIVSRQVARANARAKRKAAARKPSPAPRPAPRPHRAPPSSPPSSSPTRTVVDFAQGETNVGFAAELLRAIGPPTRMP